MTKSDCFEYYLLLSKLDFPLFSLDNPNKAIFPLFGCLSLYPSFKFVLEIHLLMAAVVLSYVQEMSNKKDNPSAFMLLAYQNITVTRRLLFTTDSHCFALL